MVGPLSSSVPGSQTGASGFRLAELILPLSLATDIGIGEPIESALRACLLAVHLGDRVGLSEAELSDVYYLVLLRFAGCTGNAHTAAAIFGDEQAFHAQTLTVDYGNPLEMMRAMVRVLGAGHPLLQRIQTLATTFTIMLQEGDEMASSHCEVAHMMAARLGMGPRVQAALLQISERWDGKGGPARLKGESIARSMRIVQLAQNVAVFHRIGGVELATTMARQWAGGAFDPALVERFCQAAPQLCKCLEVESTWDAVLAAEPGPRPQLSVEQIEAGTRAMADFVDLKSPYTVEHSSRVAFLAAAAAQRCGLPATDVACVRQAGYLHDVGQIGIPAGIWIKPGPLTEGEWERMRLHPYYTERIFARSRPLAHLGALGALHHERLDGSGYHRRLPAAMLQPAARILAAADVYHAMIESRPYRQALPPEAAADELRREVRAGRLDSEAVSAVLAVAGHRVPSTRRAWVAGLSDREVEVLRLVARGHSNKQIAARLVISKETASHHIRHIYDKIDVSTRAAATLFAMQHNLIHEPGELLSAAS
jgi:HD-GYP domain-containing protein (c-di-GMP phosphodiesterase class II)